MVSKPFSFLVYFQFLCASLSSPIIIRPHHGVFFKHIGTLDLSPSHHHHTFAIQRLHFPSVDFPHLFCPNNGTLVPITQSHSLNDYCVSLQQALNPIIDMAAKQSAQIKANLQIIEMLLPNNVSTVRRNKRGWFDFVGNIGKTVFGLATEHDMKILASHIIRLERKGQFSTSNFQHLQGELQSLSKVVNISSQAAMLAVKENHKTIVQIALQLDELIKQWHTTTKIIDHIHQVQATTLVTLQKVITSMSQLNRWDTLVYSRIQAINQLHQGYLPVHLIEPQTLSKVLTTIGASLKNNHPHYQLTYDPSISIHPYYHFRKTTFLATSKYIYIKLKIPISPTTPLFQLYKVNTLPIPTPVHLPGNRPTQITGTADYFAVNPTNKLYAELSSQTYSLCSKTTVINCHTTIPLINLDTPSCTTALFTANIHQVHQLCTSTLVAHKQNDIVVPLGEGKIFVATNMTSWSITCGTNIPKPVTGCQFCIYTLPCDCALQINTIVVPPSLNNCEKQVNTTTVFPINLPFLTHFLPLDMLQKLISQGTDNPLTFELPPIMLKSKAYGQVAQMEHQLSLNLRKIAKATKYTSPIYETPLDAFQDNDLTNIINSDPINILKWVIPLILVILCMFGTSYLLVRVRQLTAIVITLQTSIHPSESATIYYPQTTLTPSATKTSIPEWIPLMLDIAPMAIVGSIVLYLIYRLGRAIYNFWFAFPYSTRIFPSASETSLLLEITSPYHNVIIPIIKLKLPPTYVNTPIRPLIRNLAYQGGLCPTLHIEWEDIQLFFQDLPWVIALPNKVAVPLGLKKAVYEVLRQSYSCALLRQTGNIFVVIPTIQDIPPLQP